MELIYAKVIDEADRLLNQSFQSWIDRIQVALTTPIQTQPKTDTHDALGYPNSMLIDEKHDLIETFERPQRGVRISFVLFTNLI